MKRNLIMVLTVIFFGLFFWMNGEKKTPTTPKKQAASAPLPTIYVPPLEVMPPNLELVGASTPAPTISPGLVRELLEIILELKGSPHLQTARDRQILALVEKYHTGRLPFVVELGSVVAPGSRAKKRSRMAYSCRYNKYLVNGEVQSQRALLALSLYHEIDHAVDCQQRQGGHSICEVEERGYAAQVRFLVALVYSGKLSPQIHRDDTGVLGQTAEVWNEILSKSFCVYYRRALEGEVSTEDFIQQID